MDSWGQGGLYWGCSQVIFNFVPSPSSLCFTVNVQLLLPHPREPQKVKGRVQFTFMSLDPSTVLGDSTGGNGAGEMAQPATRLPHKLSLIP